MEGLGTDGIKSPLSLPLSFFLSFSTPPLFFPERRLLTPSLGSQSMLVRLESKSEDIAFLFFLLTSERDLKDKIRKNQNDGFLSSFVYLNAPSRHKL